MESIIDYERAERNEAWRRTLPPPPDREPDSADLADNAPSTGWEYEGRHYRAAR